jgi:hypothetical protein
LIKGGDRKNKRNSATAYNTAWGFEKVYACIADVQKDDQEKVGMLQKR